MVAEETPCSGESSSLLESIDLDLARRLVNDSRFRDRYFRVWGATEVANELREMRKYRKLRQGQLAALAHTGQSAISRIEQQDYDGWTFKTLLTIANALKARIRFRLERLEDVVQLHSDNNTSTSLATDGNISDGGNTMQDGLTEAGDTGGTLIDGPDTGMAANW